MERRTEADKVMTVGEYLDRTGLDLVSGSRDDLVLVHRHKNCLQVVRTDGRGNVVSWPCVRYRRTEQGLAKFSW